MGLIETDVAIIGGGIVGMATAYQLTRRDVPPRVVVIEKESRLAAHQTGHNSGVIHSGLYYRPGSLKALNCRAGKAALERFCDDEGIAWDRCGKVVVATTEEELPRLDALLERGRENGVECEMIGPERLSELEPHAAGLKAIHVPETGIVDYVAVTERLGERVLERGGRLLLGAKVMGFRNRDGRRIVETTNGVVKAKTVINCAGLHSDRVARQSGARPDAKIIPFRGEYFELTKGAEGFVKNLIYPVPDPRFPFLGVHFTRMIQGGVECGPNAVLAFAREGYTKTRMNIGDLGEALSFGGFVKMAKRHWRMGMGEMYRSMSKGAFVKALQRLVPDIRAEHLHAAPAGVRAQAVRGNGELVDDFLIDESGDVINVLNAPSPAATASLRIGEQIAERIPLN
ncbi:L-2-hydroxyglutarate oxidase [Stratiformator vulcanicus]|uniref:L-2-hydroxyglutarate oxidase LhgO n=1 Tax=Stratiformator vulcanicus TaxID=2527980 RepID=A0A517QZ68_9PLAN|nr:L-2-hydroxyglutarate oxidase [Stratiformator vulcanicus]QDT36931.1 L-2-hydroxyglutarate oxidase LhgO [Stratiformator vulcanicus]